jgi:hypothetical protein
MQKPIDFDRIWLEDRDKERVIPAVLSDIRYMDFLFEDNSGNDIHAHYEDYGSRWRAWAHKPTDEERKAAEWKD